MDSRLVPLWKLVPKGHRALVELLAERGPLIPVQVAEFLSLTREGASYSLNALLVAGVVTRTVAAPIDRAPGRPPYVWDLAPGIREFMLEAEAPSAPPPHIYPKGTER